MAEQGTVVSYSLRLTIVLALSTAGEAISCYACGDPDSSYASDCPLEITDNKLLPKMSFNCSKVHTTQIMKSYTSCYTITTMSTGSGTLEGAKTTILGCSDDPFCDRVKQSAFTTPSGISVNCELCSTDLCNVPKPDFNSLRARYEKEKEKSERAGTSDAGPSIRISLVIILFVFYLQIYFFNGNSRK